MFYDILTSLRLQAENLLPSDPFEITGSRFITLSSELKPVIKPASVIGEKIFYWSKPASHQTLIASGTLLSFVTKGSNRFKEINDTYLSWLKQWADKDQPHALLMFAFDADDSMKDSWEQMPNTLLTIPEIVFEKHKNEQRIYVNLSRFHYDIADVLLKVEMFLNRINGNGKYNSSNASIHTRTNQLISKPNDKQLWVSATQNAIETIRSSSIKKIVNSRKIAFTSSHPINREKMLQQLIQQHSSCTILSYQYGKKTVLSASPEQLITWHNKYFQTHALGGTISRSSDSPIRFNSEKNKLLHEHHIIAEEIYHRLKPYCKALDIKHTPRLMKLQNMYHLETPISGELLNKTDIFSLIEDLHPTPAVAGYPVKLAQRWLYDNEGYNRGWYTGVYGWLKGMTRGDLSVLLRCALVSGNTACLYAGAGVVLESEAEQEWQETELKINSILSAV